MILSSLYKKIYFQLTQAENILLVIHQRPDGDAWGSVLAFTESLKKLRKKYSIFCKNFSFFSPSNLFLTETVISDIKEIFKPFDLIFVFDSSDFKHAGIENLIPNLIPKPILINIDHHISNLNFGDINLIDSSAAATTEIIYKFFKNFKIKISKSIATNLLLGIITDTNYFTNPNTTLECLKIAAELLTLGARLPQINNSVLKNKSLETLKLWGRIFSRLSFNKNLKITTTIITLKDLKDFQLDTEAIEDISNFLNNLSDIKISLILREQEDGTIKGSLRTNDELLDLTKFAKILGGGGHKKAAGFTIKGRLEKIKEGWKVV